MEIEIRVPSVGESVQEAILAQWYKQDGDSVKKDEPLFIIETDKVSLEVNAEVSGILKILIPEDCGCGGCGGKNQHCRCFRGKSTGQRNACSQRSGKIC